ncbi:hypothetical protein DRJ19_03805 [Candidatus Woesearchaeota archaeon]|nr:MAG: hypothetical protein DRJ19_03805 [Candidatus Woesearchaeota archaeon]
MGERVRVTTRRKIDVFGNLLRDFFVNGEKVGFYVCKWDEYKEDACCSIYVPGLVNVDALFVCGREIRELPRQVEEFIRKHIKEPLASKILSTLARDVEKLSEMYFK